MVEMCAYLLTDGFKWIRIFDRHLFINEQMEASSICYDTVTKSLQPTHTIITHIILHSVYYMR